MLKHFLKYLQFNFDTDISIFVWKCRTWNHLEDGFSAPAKRFILRHTNFFRLRGAPGNLPSNGLCHVTSPYPGNENPAVGTRYPKTVIAPWIRLGRNVDPTANKVNITTERRVYGRNLTPIGPAVSEFSKKSRNFRKPIVAPPIDRFRKRSYRSIEQPFPVLTICGRHPSGADRPR